MKKVLVALLLGLMMFSCTVESPPEQEEEPIMNFPDPSIEDVYWDIAIVNTQWTLDSSVSVRTVGNAFKLDTRTYEPDEVTLRFKETGKYEWLSNGEFSSSEFIYDNRSLILDGRTHSLRAVVINLNEEKLAFCYNTSSIIKDDNGREMYFFSAK